MGSRVLGNLYLAYRASIVHPIRSLWGKKTEGVALFNANYRQEGLIPTLPKDRAMLAAAGRCISCGLCDRFDGQLGDMMRGSYDGVSLLPRQYARSTVELPHAGSVLRRIDPEAYREAESVCPTRVPLVALARWLRERLDRTPISPRNA